MGSQPPDGGLAVLNLRRPLGRAAQTVVDGCEGVPESMHAGPHIVNGLHTAFLAAPPPAAVDVNQQGEGAGAVGNVEIQGLVRSSLSCVVRVKQ